MAGRLLFFLGGVFALSGAAALTFEALWFHQAGLALGTGAWASALVLFAFMVGLGVGSHVAARRGDSVRSGLRAYAALEVAVGVTGVALVYALPLVSGLLAPLARALPGTPAVLHGARFVLAAVLLLGPATAMGASLPMVVRAARAWDPSFGRVLGGLYGANTAGAVVGVLVAESVLIEAVGIRGTAWVALGLCLTCAAAALGIESVASAVARPEQEKAGVGIPRKGGEIPFLAAAFTSGFLLLGLEVVWLRLLTLFLNDTSIVFATVLAVVLTGIAFGGLGASLVLGRLARAASGASLVAYMAGGLGVLALLSFPRFLTGALAPYQDVLDVLPLAAPLVLPTAIASGALLPLLGASVRRGAPSDASATGRLLLWNTLGAGLGSLVAGLVLLPMLGIECSLALLLGLYGVLGVALDLGGRSEDPLLAEIRPGARAWVRPLAPLLCFAGLFALFPFGAVTSDYVQASARRWMGAQDHLVSVREARGATIIHVEHRKNGAALSDQIATNAYSMTGNDFVSRRYMRLFADLPAAMHPGIERALLVGYGVGNTAQALLEVPELRLLQVVDVSPDMLAESRELTTKHGTEPLDDPRVRVRIEDGRFFLRATSERYDLITGEPPPPIMATVANLYTAEYFHLVRERLREGGMATYWLPLMNVSAGTARSVIAAFCEAFEDCSLWRGAGQHLLLLGTRQAKGVTSEPHFSRAWSEPPRRADLRSLGLEEPASLGALFIGDSVFLRELVAGEPPLTDDRPKRIRSPIAESPVEREAFLSRLRDASAARERFDRSPLVSRLVPEGVRRRAVARFELEGVTGDLMSREPRVSREARVLHSLLRGTDSELAVLLLLGSTPDVQSALARLPATEQQKPEWAYHRAAGLLARRDLASALPLLERAEEKGPVPDLVRYVEYAVRREAGPPRGAR